jgi:uncharacterized membrane protein YccC
MSPAPASPPVRRALRRVAADLRAGRAFLGAELSQSRWLDFGAFRWADLATGRALRAALGVITPLAIGIGTGRVVYGSYAALGALPAGFVSFQGVNRTRVLAVAATAAGMAVSTFVGAVTEASAGWLLVPAVFAWAYAAGLFAALGPTALAVSLQWPVALLIASAIPLPPEHAAFRALLVLAGGLWQGLLVVTSWAVNRGGAERIAMADSFRSLAEYAAQVAAGPARPAMPDVLPSVRALGDPNPLLQNAARQELLGLSTEADRIRSTLTALSVGRPPEGLSAAGEHLLTTAQRVLAELAESMTGRRRQRGAHLAAASAMLAGTAPEWGTPWAWSGEALLGQLRAACEIAGAEDEDEGTRTARPHRQAMVRFDHALTLRASAGASSEAGRHALRLAVTATAAEVIVRAAGLSHGYWAVLTVFIVLRPDYSSTLYRGLQRAAGTLVGAGLGLCTVLLAKVADSALLAGIGVSLLAAYAVFTVNNLLFAVFLTDFVVVLLGLLGLPPLPTALARLAGTGIGTGLALLGYLLWPTWAGNTAAETFARLVAAQGRYAAALLRSYQRPRGAESARLPGLQLAARRAHTDADAAASRLIDEPDRPPIGSELARALITSSRRVGQACLALTAAVAAHHGEQPQAQGGELQSRLDQLAVLVEQTTGQIAGWLRGTATQGGRPAATALPPLRAAWQGIWPAAADSGSDEAGLAAATDALVDAINTEAHVLRKRE